MRNVRRDANDAVRGLEKSKEISEDESKRSREEIQKVTNRAIESINRAGEVKEREILEIG